MADNQASASAPPSNTTGNSESSNTKDKEIAELQAKFAELQQAANQQVPSSVVGDSKQARADMDPDLAALDLDWGDFDPALITMLNRNEAVRDSFIAAQTLAADSTQCVDEGKMVPKSAYN